MKAFFQGLNKIKGLRVDVASVETNIVYLDILEGSHIPTLKLSKIMEEHSILLMPDSSSSGLRDTLSSEGLFVQSHLYCGQHMDTNIAGSLSEKLTIGNVEILKDQNLFVSSLKDFANNHTVQPLRTHCHIKEKASHS